ncbi:hydantoinase/oxoprolinase N-terminal domain-containing protein [Brevibacillus nitrificans]|uniref:hydantoinase/oxoprolinase N-terminal domain-containing protein n=1 Tax=Brevibacillus nitrificans TaxID=651560 RepID=UPI002615E63C|nr:hydantoinase/oxoprolinase N-terminal domain-containing protein [Brevibacillus nitrificans]
MMRLGINVGDVETSCIVMNRHSRIVALSKTATTPVILDGIQAALQQILADPGIAPHEIKAVILGTTHCYQALMNEKALAKVCAIRIGQVKGSIPPFFDASDSLREAIGFTYFELDGGHEIDGRLLGTAPSRLQLEEQLRSRAWQNIEAFAITSTFSPINKSHEDTVANWIREIAGEGYAFSLSHELGSLGFLERENTTILNAALSKVMKQILQDVEALLQAQGVHSRIYFTQNDGSLMAYEYALLYPIRTLYSGTSTGFRGASFLTKKNDFILVDIGKRNTNVGVLEEGFPKTTWKNQRIAGTFVNIQIPDIVSLPFGSDDLVTDTILDKLYQAVQRFSPQFGALPIVFVGEGSTAFHSRFRYPWAEVIQPTLYEHTSAIGACMAPVTGSVDRVYGTKGKKREEAIEAAKREAIAETIRAGAVPESVIIQKIRTLNFPEIPMHAIRVEVKAIGEVYTDF